MAKEKLEAKLVYSGSLSAGYNELYPLTKKVTTIGRLGDIKLLSDHMVYLGKGYSEFGITKYIRLSREHAKISIVGNKFVLADVGSLVGTYVNGQKLGSFQPDPWEERYCHSANYDSRRKPMIRERNKGKVVLREGDKITLGQEMYNTQHEFTFISK